MPPADKAAGWGGSNERVQYGPHDRARREHAPCKPPTGGPPGGANTGWEGRRRERHGKPPPLQREKCRASCLQRARNVLTPEDRQRGRPPPRPPSPPPNQEMGEDSLGDSEGTWGGAEDRPKRQGGRRAASGGDAKQPEPKRKKTKKEKKTKQNNAPEQGQIAETDGARQEPGSAERGAEKGETPGKKAGRQGPTPQRTAGGRGDKSPQETLVRYATSGVWGPPWCPYRPHLRAGNKVGYARDRWPAARGGTGPGGVATGPDQEHPRRHVLRFLSCEGLRVGHTVHWGRQETRLSRKDSPATHSVPDPGVGKGRCTWLRRSSICTKRVQMDGPYNRVTT